MARPVKSGLDYFPFDVTFFSDKKIKILKARYGADGITLYLYLLCLIYNNGYYIQMDDDYEFIIADDLNMNSDKVKQVLNFLLERSLFNNKLFQSDKVLTSAGIQKRYQAGVKTRATKNPVIVERFWLLTEAETETFIKVNHSFNNSWNNPCNSENNQSFSKEKCHKVKESKEKESKGEEKPYAPLTESEYQSLVNRYGKYLTDDYIERTRRYKCCSVAKIEEWIREDKDKNRGAAKGNKFNNFDQRVYDFTDLEKQLLGGERIVERKEDTGSDEE